MPKLSDSHRKILRELALGSELHRVQKYAWGPVKYLLGDKPLAPGTVAALAMGGLIRPVPGTIEIGAPDIKYELTEKGKLALGAEAA